MSNERVEVQILPTNEPVSEAELSQAVQLIESILAQFNALRGQSLAHPVTLVKLDYSSHHVELLNAPIYSAAWMAELTQLFGNAGLVLEVISREAYGVANFFDSLNAGKPVQAWKRLRHSHQ